jgi:WD40 repeat protein
MAASAPSPIFAAGSVCTVAVLPGIGALCGSSQGDLRLCDVETGQLLRSFEGHSGRVNAVAILPDGDVALSRTYVAAATRVEL